MNKQIIEILENANQEIIDEKKLRREENENAWPLTDKLVIKAKKNGIYFVREILIKIIEKYMNDPRSVGNSLGKRKDYSICYNVNVEKPCPSKKIGGRDERLAEFYNLHCKFPNSERLIYFLRSNDSKRIDDMPIKLMMDRIKQYNIFKEFERVYGENNTYIFKTSIPIDTLYNLTVKAYNDELEIDDCLYSIDVIERLKEAYIHIESIRARMNLFLTEATKNAFIIYEDIYRQLANDYVINPDEGPYLVLIDYESINNMSSEHKDMVNFFAESSMIGNGEKICYLRHDKTDFDYEYVPVYLPALDEKLNSKEDKEFGYYKWEVYGKQFEFIFYGDKVRAYMKRLKKNTENRIKKRENRDKES